MAEIWCSVGSWDFVVIFANAVAQHRGYPLVTPSIILLCSASVLGDICGEGGGEGCSGIVGAVLGERDEASVGGGVLFRVTPAPS